jgi:Circularly permutated YpsA SLOG family/Domain of unknown function (DUF6794)
MIKKIVSSGQTLAGRAGLDVAIELGIQHGGWTSMGRRAQDRELFSRYNLQETGNIGFSQSAELNILESDGTLILTHGRPKGGSQPIQQVSKKHHRPCLYIDLNEIGEAKAVQIIAAWIEARKMKTLNVTGLRGDKDPEIHEATKRILITVFSGPPLHILSHAPKTVDEVVERLISEMPLREKTTVANMTEEELPLLHPALGDYIRNRFGLGLSNEKLNASCRFVAGKKDIRVDEASALIIHELWKKLRETHTLRTVKS